MWKQPPLPLIITIYKVALLLLSFLITIIVGYTTTPTAHTTTTWKSAVSVSASASACCSCSFIAERRLHHLSKPIVALRHHRHSTSNKNHHPTNPHQMSLPLPLKSFTSITMMTTIDNDDNEPPPPSPPPPTAIHHHPSPLPPPPPKSSVTSAAAAAVKFAHLAGKLKTTPRTGWVLRHIPHPESVADHSWRVAVLCLLLCRNNSNNIDNTTNNNTHQTEEVPPLDIAKCMEMAIVHDLAESIVGDIAPSDNVEKDVKMRLEEEAMATIAHLLGLATTTTTTNDSGTNTNGGGGGGGEQRLLKIFHEYEQRETQEAIVVKDLDLLDMILQAQEYETQTYNDKDVVGIVAGQKKGIDLEEFFQGTPPSRFRDERLREVAEEVHRQRGEDVARRKRLVVVEEDGDGDGGEGDGTGTKVLSEEDVAFVTSYAASSNLSVEEAEALVVALRKRDANVLDSTDAP